MFARSRKAVSSPTAAAPAPAPRRRAKAPAINPVSFKLATSIPQKSPVSPAPQGAPARPQPTLTVNHPGDAGEQEADRIADQAMAAPAHPADGAALSRSVPHAPRQVARTPAAHPSSHGHGAPPIVHQALRTHGQPLEPATRRFMEGRLGHDLGQVRVHTGATAAQSADAVNALAYTAGQDVVFGAGQYAPGTTRGDRLLAHELVHTVQQSGAGWSRAGHHGDGRGAGPTIQRSMKLEFQTGNYVWKVDSHGRTEPLPRRYGASPDSEGGDKNFLTTGVKGDPRVEVGEMVKAKDADETKPAEFVQTFKVIDEDSGKVELLSEEKREGEVNKGTYEMKYVDASGIPLNKHLTRRGEWKKGPGPLMKKATEAKEGTAIELQSESHGFIEFETPKWFRKWSDLKERVVEAVDMTKTMSAAPLVADETTKEAVRAKIETLKGSSVEPRTTEMGALHEWPSSLGVADLPVIKEGGRLLVEIVDPTWFARIQVSESIALTQFESLLEEHHPSMKEHAVPHAEEIVRKAVEGAPPTGDIANLTSFLQLIFYYIERGQREDIRRTKADGTKGPPGPSKFAFALMSRTSFSSIFEELLSDEEKEIFRKIVKDKLIIKELIDKDPSLGLTTTSKFFKFGHGGGSTLGPTIDAWLKSIVDPARHGRRVKDKEGKPVNRDLLSPPKSGAAAMGAFDVDKEEGSKDKNLVRFEVRSSSAHMGGNDQPASKWVEYVQTVFKHAAEERVRPGPDGEPDDTSLIYDEPVKPRRWEAGIKFGALRGDEEGGDFEVEFRRNFPTLLSGHLQPFIYTGIGTRGLSAGVGANYDPINGMGLFLAGKGGIRSEWFQSIEVSGALEAGWVFGEDRILRMGVGYERWKEFSPEEKKGHLFYLFGSYNF